MMKILPGALAALLATAVLAAPAQAGPTVTVRVEGEQATLLERTQVTLPDTPPPVTGCPRWTVAAAIEEATKGNWDRDDFVQTILGESHTFSDNDYWALWNGVAGDYRFSQFGICQTVMSEAQEALLLVDRTPPPTFASTSFPLGLRGVPAIVRTGTQLTVSVVTFALDGVALPLDGATVAGGGATAVTGADGKAVLSLSQPGAFTIKASKSGSVVSAGERTTVSAGPVAPPPTAALGTEKPDDKTAPVATFSRLKNGRVYKRKRAPRKVEGSITSDPSGLLSVRLSISRKTATGCWAFDGARERFKPHRCGGWRSFRIGDRAEWSYLLPKRLPKGRYRIRAVAIDKAGNESVRQVRFRVR